MKEGAERKACEVILSFEARIGGCVTLLIRARLTLKLLLSRLYIADVSLYNWNDEATPSNNAGGACSN